MTTITPHEDRSRVQLPPHDSLIEPWQQSVRGGSVEDRRLAEVHASIPPHIEDLAPAIPSSIGAAMDEALRSVAALDETHGEHLASLSVLLLRAESVASSKIEHVEASLDDYARAMHGSKANSSATSMVASTRALDALIRSVQDGQTIAIEDICTAHRILMADDPSERAYAGRTRDMQNWIGGSDYSPRGADYVPPPPRLVDGYLADLLAFANRADINVLAQAAITHAQFESIHPFTDGNGRIGRALINTVLRKRRTTTRVVVPLASALVARRDAYFETLSAYREGDAGPIIGSFANASTIASLEAKVTAERLASMPDQWREAASRPRSGSAAAKLLDTLLNHPVFSADEAVRLIGGATSSVYGGISRLQEAEVIRPLTSRTRNQVWVAASLAAELDDLGVRIAARARAVRD
jgi:Fic family protein